MILTIPTGDRNVTSYYDSLPASGRRVAPVKFSGHRGGLPSLTRCHAQTKIYSLGQDSWCR